MPTITISQVTGGNIYEFSIILSDGKSYIFNQTAPDEITAITQLVADFSSIVTSLQSQIKTP